MVIDTSAVVALLLDEPEAEEIGDILAAEPDPLISAATLLEASIVMETKKGPAGTELVDDLIGAAGLRVIAVDENQAKLAREAFTRFGKGRRNPAGLNFGDCFSYALARSMDRPLLFKGSDFAATDVAAARQA